MKTKGWGSSILGIWLGLGMAGSGGATPQTLAQPLAQLFIESPDTQPFRIGDAEIRELLQQGQRDTERRDVAAVVKPLARFVYSEDESRFATTNETVRTRLFGRFAHEQEIRQNFAAVAQVAFLTYRIDDVLVSPDGKHAIARDRALIDVTLVDGSRLLVASGAVTRWAMVGDRPQMISSQTHSEVLPVSTLPPRQP
ncbi:MAG: hypothetical protein HC918_07845 [Oscillatoriales cyanobacterium SM2_1_8]|nr:hypothetical protein [Oscillatoriales cyanobacterium SM2_1_8]